MAIGSKTGQGGKSFQDRELAAQVRSLALNKIKIILERPTVEMSERDKELHDAILVRMSTTILPRLNEHSGPDGGDIPLPIYAGLSLQTNTGNKKAL